MCCQSFSSFVIAFSQMEREIPTLSFRIFFPIPLFPLRGRYVRYCTYVEEEEERGIGLDKLAPPRLKGLIFFLFPPPISMLRTFFFIKHTQGEFCARGVCEKNCTTENCGKICTLQRNQVKHAEQGLAKILTPVRPTEIVTLKSNLNLGALSSPEFHI